MYLPTMALQTRIFLLSIGLGFLLGFLYDIFYISRLAFTKSKYAVYIQDFIYLLICSFATFIFILSLSSGVVRYYILVGELLGWLIYYLSTGLFVVAYADKAVKAIKLFINKTIRVLLIPIKWIKKKITLLFKKISDLFKKLAKKVHKIVKRYLKYTRGILYNKIDKVRENSPVGEGNDKI